LHIVCLHHLFWNDSKVSGTKIRYKTARGYSGIPGDDMRGPRLKAGSKGGARFIVAASPADRRRALCGGECGQGAPARGTDASRAGICVRINNVYLARSIVLF